MNYRVVTKNGFKYIDCRNNGNLLQNERDALDWVAICGEHQVSRLMLHAGNLTRDFYDLRTGVAGDILLKFTNYRIKVAAVLAPELVGEGRFREMVRETNRGNDFRVFYRHEDAEAWLLQ